MSLGKQSFLGATWTLLDIIFNKAIYFVSTLILARLLGPAEFGTLGMIMVFFTIGTTFTESGLSVSIIRTPSPSPIEYSTVFYLNLLLSLLAYLLMFFIAPIVANFYHQEIITNLIRVYCLAFFISAIRIIPNAILVKEMNFKKIALLNIPGNIVGLVVGIWMAFENYKVWSLVGLFLSTQLVSSIIYCSFSNWKPTFHFSSTYVKLHWKFGYKLMLSAQLNTIFENIYNILIGKFYSVQSLGYYERAYTLCNYPISVLSLITNKISLPLFSKVAFDKDKARYIYRKVMLLTFYVTAPLMLGAIILSKPLIVIILGSQWEPAVPLFEVLCLSYIFYPIHTLNINILTAHGRSDLFLKLELIKKAVFVLVVIIGFNFGIMGLVWSSVAGSVLSLFINTYYSGELINYNTKRQLLDILPILLISTLMALVVYLTSLFIIKLNLGVQLVFLVVEGIIVFFTLSIITKNESFLEILGRLKFFIKKIK